MFHVKQHRSDTISEAVVRLYTAAPAVTLSRIAAYVRIEAPFRIDKIVHTELSDDRRALETRCAEFVADYSVVCVAAEFIFEPASMRISVSPISIKVQSPAY